jgi:hypothetical protein
MEAGASHAEHRSMQAILPIACVEEREQSASCENNNAAAVIADRLFRIISVSSSAHRVQGIASEGRKRHPASVSDPLVL